MRCRRKVQESEHREVKSRLEEMLDDAERKCRTAQSLKVLSTELTDKLESSFTLDFLHGRLHWIKSATD